MFIGWAWSPNSQLCPYYCIPLALLKPNAIILRMLGLGYSVVAQHSGSLCFGAVVFGATLKEVHFEVSWDFVGRCGNNTMWFAPVAPNLLWIVLWLCRKMRPKRLALIVRRRGSSHRCLRPCLRSSETRTRHDTWEHFSCHHPTLRPHPSTRAHKREICTTCHVTLLIFWAWPDRKRAYHTDLAEIQKIGSLGLPSLTLSFCRSEPHNSGQNWGGGNNFAEHDTWWFWAWPLHGRSSWSCTT